MDESFVDFIRYNTKNVGSPVKCKPFHADHTKQIKLVGDLSWFDPKALDGLDNEIIEILSRSEYMDENRRDRIAASVVNRCGEIDKLS